MATEKLSVSFDPDLAAAIRAAQDANVSVSTWLAEAAEVKVRQRRLREALDDFAAEHGPLEESDIDRLISAARSSSTVAGRGAA
ncbi:MAG: hypothetical protein ACRD1K_09910 [Acidimicrobiales bacterium]